MAYDHIDIFTLERDARLMRNRYLADGFRSLTARLGRFFRGAPLNTRTS